MAAALLNAREDCRKTQPGASTHGLRGEERLEQPRLGTGVHADPRVRNAESDVAAGSEPDVVGGKALVEIDVCCIDSQPAAVEDCVPRIQREVEDDLLDLSPVGANGR